MNVRTTKITRSGSMSSGISERVGKRWAAGSLHPLAQQIDRSVNCYHLVVVLETNVNPAAVARRSHPMPKLAKLSQPLKNHHDETLARCALSLNANSPRHNFRDGAKLRKRPTRPAREKTKK